MQKICFWSIMLHSENRGFMGALVGAFVNGLAFIGANGCVMGAILCILCIEA